MTLQDAIRDMVAACLRLPVWSLVISKIFWESLAKLACSANAVAGKQGT
jgi:hypothetical protein